MQHMMRSGARRNPYYFCSEVDGLFDLNREISLIQCLVMHARSDEASKSLVFSLRVRIGCIGRSEKRIFPLIIQHSLDFFAALDFLGGANYPGFAMGGYIYASPVDALCCPFCCLILRIDIMMIIFMSLISQMYIIIRMRLHLRFIDVFGWRCKMCLFSASLECNFCLCCLVILRLYSTLCSCCVRWLI